MVYLGMKHWLFAAAITTAVTMASVARAASADTPQPLRLMTYNIRLDLASDGANAWANRRHWVAAQVLWLRPDIFGLQEVLPNQKSDLIADLPQYRLFGGGRDGKEKGEASPIGYDIKRFDFVEGGVFWLSPTPEVPSRAWDAAYPRIATWVRLKIRDSKQVVLAINTHWDHIGIIARRKSAAQIVRWIEANARRCDSVLLFGDFNSEDDSEQIRAVTQSPLALRDARAVSKSAPFGPSGTFNGFQTTPPGSRAIDHMLLGSRIEVERYAVFSQVIEGRVPSDHFPVLADLSLTPCR
jgi:endonuclease/exonuclease/phosphatase family metal-dependent hydrolase